jgi:3-oxosteroid 1-dehydrogenase
MGHTYAGPGATIGPALAFGYLAVEDIAGSGGTMLAQRGTSVVETTEEAS